MSDTEKQVQKALETYKSAVLAKDAETFMHLYDADVRKRPANPPCPA
jgi:hypothetical protein